MLNLLLSLFTIIFAVTDLGLSIYAWWICDNDNNTAMSAQVGGFVAGLAVGYIVLNKYRANKYQESVGQEGLPRGFYTRMRRSCDPVLRKLFTGQSTLLFT